MIARNREKKDFIEEIIVRELTMFLSAPSAWESPCQEHPESVELHRRAQFSCWSKETHESHLHDLERAKENGTKTAKSQGSSGHSLISPSGNGQRMN